MSDMYEFHVKGPLDDRWSDWFGGLTMRHQKDATTVLAGAVVDQAALHGVLVRIRDLSLPLLSAKRVPGLWTTLGVWLVVLAVAMDLTGALLGVAPKVSRRKPI